MVFRFKWAFLGLQGLRKCSAGYDGELMNYDAQGKWKFPQRHSVAEILTSNSVGTKLFFLGCNQDNNCGSNFITKKKICLVLPEKEISNHRN